MAAKNERLKTFLDAYGAFMVGVIYLAQLTAGIVNLLLAIALPVQFPEVFGVNVMRPWATAFTIWLSSYAIGSSASSLLVANVQYARTGRERARAREYQARVTLQLLSANRWTLLSAANPYLLIALCCYWHLAVCPCYQFGGHSTLVSMEDYSRQLRIACYRLTSTTLLVTMFACLLQMAAVTFTLTAKHMRKIKAIKNS